MCGEVVVGKHCSSIIFYLQLKVGVGGCAAIQQAVLPSRVASARRCRRRTCSTRPLACVPVCRLRGGQ